LAGIEWFPAIWLGGALFGLSVFLAGHLTPNYSHFCQSISELGVRDAPYSRLVRFIGFFPLGLSFVIYAHQTMGSFANVVPVTILLLIGLAIFIAGMYPTDPQNRRDTVSGKIHAMAVVALLFLLGVAPFAFSVAALYRIPPAPWFFVFSLSMGLLTLVFLMFAPKGGRPMRAAIHQRLLLSLHCFWWSVLSVVLAMPAAGF